MSDDIRRALESSLRTQKKLLARVAALEQEVTTAGAADVPAPGGWGYCSPTSPPSQQIQVRRAFAWYLDSLWGEDYKCVGWPDMMPTLTISAFTNAYYYRAVLPFMAVAWSGYDAFMVWEDGTEYETYEECAAVLMTDLFYWNVEPDYDGWPLFPLCAIAVRNDGTTGEVNRFHPITLSDRGLSSFVMRDLRPWFTVQRVRT